jgi:hypothetical protein
VFAIDRDYTLPAGDTVGTIVVIGGNAIVEGTVEETLIVIDGTATVNGRVDGDVNVWSGDLVLGAGSQVNNIFLFRSDLTRDGGAVVTGNIDRESGFVLQGWAVLLGILLAIGITVTMLLTGQAVAAIAGQQLAETATTMRTHVGTSILTGVLTVILMPVAAAVFIATIVGIPFGLAMLFVVMPALAVLGFVVAGTWLGSLIYHGGSGPRVTTVPGGAGGAAHPRRRAVRPGSERGHVLRDGHVGRGGDHGARCGRQCVPGRGWRDRSAGSDHPAMGTRRA